MAEKEPYHYVNLHPDHIHLQSMRDANLSDELKPLMRGKHRAAVPFKKVKWDEDYPTYSPPWVGPAPEKVVLPKELITVETSEGVAYDEKGYPRNPIGRTGLRGMGVYKKMGETLEVRALLLRERRGSGALEALLWQPARRNIWAVPGRPIGTLTDMDRLTDLAAGAASNFLTKGLRVTRATTKFNKEQLIFRGYGDHGSNTDNAWLGLLVFGAMLNDKDAYDVSVNNAKAHWHPVEHLPAMAANQDSIVDMIRKAVAPRRR